MGALILLQDSNAKPMEKEQGTQSNSILLSTAQKNKTKKKSATIEPSGEKEPYLE